MTAQYRIELEPKRVLAAITCNACGKRAIVGDHVATNDMNRFAVEGSYGSTYPHDCASISFHLCGGCIAAIVARFKVMPTMGSYLPGLDDTGSAEDMNGAQAWFDLVKHDVAHEHVKAARESNEAMNARWSAGPPEPAAVCLSDELATDEDRAAALGTYDDFLLLPLSLTERARVAQQREPDFWYGALPLPVVLPETTSAEPK